MITLVLALLSQVDQGKVDAAVDRGAKYLLERKLAPVKHPFEGEFSEDELVLYTLIEAGATDNPTFKSLLERVLASEMKRTYNVSLQAIALQALDAKKYQERIAQGAQFLVDNQAKNGQWGYGKPIKEVVTGGGGASVKIKRRTEGSANGDNSNSQYAALGLRACIQANVKLPDETLSLAAKFWEKAQNADGGWGYNGEGSVNDPSCGSMTAGAVASLCILRVYTKVNPQKDEAVKKGLEWMAQNLKYDENPKYMKPKLWKYYWIYAIERVGMLYGGDKIGSHSWYREGAECLLKEQKKDGSWQGGEKDEESLGGAVADTCFAILFLRKATKALPKVATGK